MNAWLVRAGDDNSLIDFFWNNQVVAIGWHEMADTTNLNDRESYKNAYITAYPTHSNGRVGVNSGQIFRFEKEIKKDDYILSFNKISREYSVGKCTSEAYFDITKNHDYPRLRKVDWVGKFKRSSLSSEAQNSFGSVLTVFSITQYLNEIISCLEGKVDVVQNDISEQDESFSLFDDIKTKADEKISDLISQLDPYDFQFLIGAIFRAMGFKTIEKDPGRDRGIDIIAFKDEFGFEKPRIKIQVKHRVSAAGGPDVRNFIGTLDEGEYGIFISSGGYKGDALKESERFSTKIALYKLDEVIELLVKYYDKLEAKFKSIVPLAQVWIPLK